MFNLKELADNMPEAEYYPNTSWHDEFLSIPGSNVEVFGNGDVYYMQYLRSGDVTEEMNIGRVNPFTTVAMAIGTIRFLIKEFEGKLPENQRGFRVFTDPAAIAAEVAKIIRLTPKRWDQKAWFTSEANADTYVAVSSVRESLSSEPYSCGTTACVAGWTAVVSSPANAKLNGSRITVPSSADFPSVDRYIESYAQGKLQLTSTQSHWLFYAQRSKEQVLWALDKIAEGNHNWHYTDCPFPNPDDDDDDPEDDDY